MMPIRQRTTLELDKDLINWHRSTFPNTSLWVKVNELLRSYKEVMEADPPKDYYLIGARHLKEKIDHDLRSMEE
jgi:hypothetical protein